MVKYLMEADSLEVSSTAMDVTPTFIEVHKYIIFHASCRKLPWKLLEGSMEPIFYVHGSKPAKCFTFMGVNFTSLE